MSICLPSLVWRKWNGFCLSQGAIFRHEWPNYSHWCEENEMVFVSNEVPFHGTEFEVKTIALYSPALVGEDYYEKNPSLWNGFFSARGNEMNSNKV